MTAPDPLDEFVQHMTGCRGATAAVVFDRGLSSDETVASLLAAGWTWSSGDAESSTESFAGKRIRYLVPPPGGATADDLASHLTPEQQ